MAILDSQLDQLRGEKRSLQDRKQAIKTDLDAVNARLDAINAQIADLQSFQSWKQAQP